jgi:hypothetical protein
VAVQATNEAKARAGIERLTRDGGDPVGFAYRDGYAILSSKRQIAERAAADAGTSNLHDAANFSADMKLLGDTGVSAGWVDTDRVIKEAGGIFGATNGLTSIAAQGRAAYVVRFVDGGTELVVKARGRQRSTGKSAAGFPKLGDLPASTVAAVDVRGTEQIVDQIWTAMNKQAASTGASADIQDFVAQAKEHVGLTLPDDLKTLLGSEVVVALDSAGLGGDDMPQFGARSATDGNAAASVLNKLKASPDGSSYPLSWKQRPDGVVVASNPAYADKLANVTGAKLADQQDFRDAVPEADTSIATGFVSLRSLGDIFASTAGDKTAQGWLTTFSALGFSVTATDDIITTHVRLLLR